MYNLYRFSPITTENEFTQVLDYLVVELEKLSLKLTNQKLPINTLKVFAHYPEEYKFLYKLVTELGPAAPFNSQTSYYAKVKMQIRNYDIEYVGVRVVDPYRLHVGCGDYEVKDFVELKENFAGKSEYIRSFREDMIEMWHPNFDVLGYVVPPLN